MKCEEEIHMNHNRLTAILFIVVACVLSFSGCSPKTYRVGVLSGISFVAEITDGFKAGMTELGYVDGRNITYDVRKTDFDMDTYGRILGEFVKNKVDMILVFPTEAAQVAKKATEGTNIPVVFTNSFTENTGLIDSIQEPGGNITGVRWPGPEIVTRGFEIFREIKPNAASMIVAYLKDFYPRMKNVFDTLRPAAASANIALIEVPATDPSDLGNALVKLKGPFDTMVIHTVMEPLVITPAGFAAAAKFAAEHDIPIGGAPIFEGEYQSVFGFIPPPQTQGKQAAYLADRIFKGTPAGKLPVMTAEYSFIVNYRQAEKIGLKVSERLLSQANQIIR
jgi:putative ABC transport system substrate-binding protein